MCLFQPSYKHPPNPLLLFPTLLPTLIRVPRSFLTILQHPEEAMFVNKSLKYILHVKHAIEVDLDWGRSPVGAQQCVRFPGTRTAHVIKYEVFTEVNMWTSGVPLIIYLYVLTILFVKLLE